MLRHGSLFSGIGGFDLAADWMGWTNEFHCEWNPFGQRVLNYYWPNAKSYTDITKTDFSIHRGAIDVLTGGFPCQPYSTSGNRKGKDDERHLWPEMLRAITEIQPRWVVGENVLGLVNWNGGMVFDEVQFDLETAFKNSKTCESLKQSGYESFPYILPAAGVNAPHQRYRVWFVAYSNANGREGIRGLQKLAEQGESTQSKFINGASTGNVADASIFRSQGLKKVPKGENSANRITWSEFPTESPVCDGNDGISSRLVGITFSSWREQSIMGAGNAIVPQLALKIFNAIEQFELLN